MKVATQNTVLLLWTVLCTVVLFCIAVFGSTSKDMKASTFPLPLPDQETTHLLAQTGSGSIQSMVQNELDFMHGLLTHTEKGLVFSDYIYNTTENAELRFLADNLQRRFRYSSLLIRKWLHTWYGEDTTGDLSPNIPLPMDIAQKEAEEDFLAFMLRHNQWESALTQRALSIGIRQELAEHMLKNNQVRLLEKDVITHLQGT